MAIVSFEITVDDPEAVGAVYDRIQVFRSTDQGGIDPPYEELTAATALPAIVDGTVPGPWNLHGQALGISLSSADVVTVSFTDPDPYNLKQVLDVINAVVPDLASPIPDANRVRLTTPITGTGATIALSGLAVTTLGFASLRNGRSARPILHDATTSYSFRDFAGSLSHWYRTRFYSSKTQAASLFSSPRQGAAGTVFGQGLVAKAKVYIADGSGTPIAGRRVIFLPMSVATLDIGSGVVYGSLPGVDRLVAITDDSGYAEMHLVIGSTYRVFFEGTSYQRELIVPDVSEFDLLTALSTSPDVFTPVRTPALPIRMS